MHAHPERLAIADGNEALTYAELGRLCERWSAALPLAQADGSGVSQRAAVLMTHGAPVVAGALAAVSAGYAVVVLNPTDPAARHAQILAAAEPSLLLVDVAHAESGAISVENASSTGVAPDRTVVLDLRADDTLTPIPSAPTAPDDPRAPTAPDDPRAPTAPDDLAFLICTSGTTGRPKMVMQTHRNVLHNVLRNTNALDISPDDRVAWFASLSGGQGMVTVWTALLNGCTLCPYSLNDDGMIGLKSWLKENRVTVFDTLPSVLRNFCRTLGDERLEGIRLVRLASEAGFQSDFELFRRHFPSDCTLASVLASSETGILTVATLDPRDDVPPGHLVVGEEVDGVRLTLVDDDGTEVGAGEAGEIVVESRYLSPGYWQDPGLTAERFTGQGGQRRFHTRDVGRRSATAGELRVIGRTDSQVKIRGHRLQLEEVEGAMAALPEVADAAVVAIDSGDALALSGFVVPASPNRVDPARIRRELARILPPHAIPATLAVIDELPLTPTGKIDRTALKAAAVKRETEPAEVLTEPEDVVEATLIRIWEELLEKPVGLDDAFFDLGGDSLSAMEMLVEVDDRLGCTLTPAALLTARTVRELAETIRAVEQDGRLARTPQLLHAKAEGPAVLLGYPIGGNGLRYRWLAEELGRRYPLYIPHAPWWDGKRSRIRTLEQMAAHHIEQLRLLQPHGPYLLAGNSSGGLLCYEIACQLQEAGEEIGLLAVVDTYAGLRPHERFVSDPRTWPMPPPASRGRAILRRAWLFYATRRLALRKLLRVPKRPAPWKPIQWWWDILRHGAVAESRRSEFVTAQVIAALDRYRPRRLRGPVHLFRCTADVHRPPDRGWRAMVGDQLVIHDLPGKHTEALFPPVVFELAPALAALIDEARRRPAGGQEQAGRSPELVVDRGP